MSILARASTRVLLAVLVPLSLLLTGCGGPDLIDRLSQRQWGFCGTIIVILDIVALVDLLGGDAYDTTGQVIWTVLIVFFPVGGIVLYALFGR